MNGVQVKGRIKAGEGPLIGNAGEYYVVAELLKRGIVASLAPRNAPAFDVLATKGPWMVRIRVKTKSEQYNAWQWNAKKDGAIFSDLHNCSDFTVLVNLTRLTRDLAFFIVPTKLLNQWLVSDFKKWVETLGRNGRPHDENNRKRNLGYLQYARILEPYRDEWDILWRADVPQS